MIYRGMASSFMTLLSPQQESYFNPKRSGLILLVAVNQNLLSFHLHFIIIIQ